MRECAFVCKFSLRRQAELAVLRSERDLLRKQADSASKKRDIGQKQAFNTYNFSALTQEVKRLTMQLSEEAAGLMHDLQGKQNLTLSALRAESHSHAHSCAHALTVSDKAPLSRVTQRVFARRSSLPRKGRRRDLLRHGLRRRRGGQGRYRGSTL